MLLSDEDEEEELKSALTPYDTFYFSVNLYIGTPPQIM
jgi:hypothetical protein